MHARTKYYTLFYDDQRNITGGDGSDYVYNSQGFLERKARLAYDPAVGLYEESAVEYEYFDVPQGESSYNYIRKTTNYNCPNGSFTLEPYSREEWQEDRLRGKGERHIDGRWYTTYLSTMDDFGLTRTEEWYSIENGSARLTSKTTETRRGNSSFNEMWIRCRTYQSFDEYGNVSYGSKEDHLADYGYDLEIDYYRWNTSTREWEIDYIEYPEGEPYEGMYRRIFEQPIMIQAEQVYHNGKWETIEFSGSLEAEPAIPYGTPGYDIWNTNYLHWLNYRIDTNTGNYEYYHEQFTTYENGRRVSYDMYDMPNRAHQAYRYEFDYTPVGDPAETRYFNTETGSLELSHRDVYEYDPSIIADQVLHQENTAINKALGGYFYDADPFPNGHAKPLSEKRYDAAGNFMEDLTLYYYSSLHGDIDEGLPEITPDDPYGDQNPFLNLMGQPLASPLPGQPVIDVRHRQVIVR